MYILVYMRYFSVAEARAKFASILKLSTTGEEEVVITKNGEPAVIVLNFEKYESMIETMEIMSDPELHASILEFKNNPDVELYSLEQVRTELEHRLLREKVERDPV